MGVGDGQHFYAMLLAEVHLALGALPCGMESRLVGQGCRPSGMGLAIVGQGRFSRPVVADSLKSLTLGKARQAVEHNGGECF